MLKRLVKASDQMLSRSPAGDFYNRYIRFQMVQLGMALPFSPIRAWKDRVQDVLDAPDNLYIPRVPHAGEIRGGFQIMHNGLVIAPGSYYGLTNMLLLNKNRGVHEPQEERVFAAMLPHLKPGAVMLELGAYWGFYSMWLLKEVPRAVAFLVEPDPLNLAFGKENFRLNGFQGTFIHAYAGASAGTVAGARQLSVDGLVAEHSIPFIHVLHSDIQGAEFEMLEGASESFRAEKIGFVFISTHSKDLHRQCRKFLEERGFVILASADLDETYSYDGLLVARASGFTDMEPVPIARKVR